MKIIENVYQLDSVKGSHVFLIKTDENILIDTGMPGASDEILTELNELGVKTDQLDKILLTHHDVDHIGNAANLQQKTGARIWAPADDIPYILGDRQREGIKRFIGKFLRIQKPDKISSYGSDQVFGGVQIIPAPGHTPGHSMIRYQNVLFIGDLFKVTGTAITPLPKMMNLNHDNAIKAATVLINLDVEWLCPSHGNPIRYDMAMAKLPMLLQQSR